MTILCSISLVAFFLYAINEASCLPIVQKSHLTRKCVKVMSMAEKFDCDNLPNKYVVEWVQ